MSEYNISISTFIKKKKKKLDGVDAYTGSISALHYPYCTSAKVSGGTLDIT